jgi:hypothetical protein
MRQLSRELLPAATRRENKELKTDAPSGHGLAAALDGEGATMTSAEEMSGATMRSALLKTGLQFHTEHVLTPRGKDLDPGSWTRGHRSSAVYHPNLMRQLRSNREVDSK